MRERHVAVDVLEAARVCHAVRGLRNGGCAASSKCIDDAEHLIRPGLGHGRE